MRFRSLLSALALVMMFPAAGPGLAAESGDPETTRLYLLASDQDFLYWSPDPGDPEAAALSARRGCGGPNPGGLCPSASENGYFLTIPFMPAAVLDGPVEWGEQRPVRFHLELDVESTGAATVHAIAASFYGLHESSAATEVSPGVWEGTISTGHEVVPGDVLSLGIRVRAPSQARTKVAVDIRTAGQSWFEFPGRLPLSSVPQLLERSTYAPEPNVFSTPDRSFRFNDRDWKSFSFSGDLSETKTFTVALERPAAAVVGWIEGFSKPLMHGVLNADPEARTPLETGFVRLASNGSDLSRHRYSAAAVDVPDGTVEMHVEPPPDFASRPYRAHLVVIHGVRTLAAMRWRFEVPAQHHRVPTLTSCPLPREQVPSTAEVTTFRVDLRGSSPSPLPKSWTIVFDISDFVNPGFCGTIGNGGGIRFALGGSRVALVGPAPSPSALTLSSFDTEFEAEVRYAYTPPPCEETGDCPDRP